MASLGLRSPLSRLISTADYMPDTGFLYLDARLRVLSASKLLIQLSEVETIAALEGRHIFDAYSAKFSELINSLIEKAKSARQLEALNVSDWTPYSSLGLGPAVLVVAPSYDRDEFVGASVIISSTQEIKSAEDAAAINLENYRVLFDNLPIGVAVFQPSVAADGGPDGYLVEANAAFQKTMEGIPLPYQEPCSVVWPSFMRQTELRKVLSDVMAGAKGLKSELFSPALGNHFEVVLAPMPSGRLLTMISDLTDAKLHESKVLTLNDQLQRTLAKQNEFLGGMLDDIHQFNQARSDMIEFQLERITDKLAEMSPAVAADVGEAVAALNRGLQQVLRYHNVSSLPFKDTSLVRPADIVSGLVTSIGARFPHVSFELGNLPSIVASEEVLSSILEQLLVSIASLPVSNPPAKIRVGYHSAFLDTGIFVAGWGFDTSPLLLEVPTEMQPLDWTLTSDLDIAPARCMVVRHGGKLCVGATEDGDGFALAFTIGTPA